MASKESSNPENVSSQNVSRQKDAVAIRPRNLSDFVDVVLCAVVALGAWVFLWQASFKVGLQYQLDFGEGLAIATAQQVAKGLTAYPPLNALPYYFSPYGPVFYYLMALPLRISGISFTGPRTLLLLALLACPVLLAFLLRNETGSRKNSFLFGFLFLSLPVVRLWSGLMRPDALAIALSFGGLCLFLRRRDFLAVVLFVAALFVKPTSVAAPAAGFVYLLLQLQWRRAARFAIFGCVLGGASLLLTQMATHGQFLRHTLDLHPGEYKLDQFFRFVFYAVSMQPVLLLLAMFYVLRDCVRRRISLFSVYFCTSSLTLLSLGKLGANSNYSLEWAGALCLASGMGYASLSELFPSNPVRFKVVIAAGILLAFALFSPLLFMPWKYMDLDPQMPELLPWAHHEIAPGIAPGLNNCATMQAYLRTLPGDKMLSENAGAALLANKTLLISDMFVYDQLSLHSPGALVPVDSMVKNKEVDWILTAAEIPLMRRYQTDRWPASLLDAIEENYTLRQRFLCTDARALYGRRSP